MVKNTFITLHIIMLLNLSLYAQNAKLELYYEQKNYLETPNYEETINFCKKLDIIYKEISYTSYGKSPQGRDLPLLIFDTDGLKTISQVRKAKKLVVMVQACIHAGEPDGKDAGLMLLRDIATKKFDKRNFSQLTILFLPIVNVDGHERRGKYNRINQNGPIECGWRTTAQNYNLNRDFLKADALETQYWLKLFNTWLPDFFIDIHVTDGADYQYPITYALESKGDIPLQLKQWLENSYLKNIDSIMGSLGKPIFPYVEFRRWHDPRSGLIGWVAPAMLSQGYVAANNRPGLLLETHMLKPYKERVDATYQMLFHTLILLNKECENLRSINNTSDEIFTTESFKKNLLKFNFNPTGDSTLVDFLGYRYDTVISNISGGIWFKYSKDSVTFKIPYFNHQVAEDSIELPVAYIIPIEWLDIIHKMELHGVKINYFKTKQILKLATTRFNNVKFASKPNENHQKVVSFDKFEKEESVLVGKGDAILFTNQRLAKIITYALEPMCYDSYFRWGYFNGILQQKEYSESYVMESMARTMLSNDSHLKREFELKIQADSSFKGNSYEILNWFYEKTPYWDDNFNKYPIYKCYDKNILKGLY